MPDTKSAEQIYASIGTPRYFHSYGEYIDMRAVGKRLGGGPVHVPNRAVMADCADAFGFLVAEVESEDGDLEDVIMRKKPFKRFADEWVTLGLDREQAADSDYVIERIRERREQQAAKQEAARQRREQPRPWSKITINHSGDTVAIDAEIDPALENNMIAGVTDEVATKFDPDDAEYYQVLAAVTGPHPWGVYLSGPVLLVTSDEEISVGQQVYPVGPREVSCTGDTPIGRCIGTKHVSKRGELLMIRFDSL
jgi:hypothetical protein